jgi:hypothetical protein
MGLANPTAVMAKGASSWALGLILILSRLAVDRIGKSKLTSWRIVCVGARHGVV